MVKVLHSGEFDTIDKSGTILLDFNANWCGPCKMLAPVLEKVSEEYAGKVSFYSVNVDENGRLAEEFSVVSIPNLVILKDGEIADTMVGFSPEPALKRFIDKNL